MYRYDVDMTNHENFALADPLRDQYFLTAPDKLSLLIQAADIHPTDHVVEVGAGIGTVAQALPPSASLTLIEIDSRFSDILQANVPNARVIQGDGLALLRNIQCDVLISNLPTSLAEPLIDLLSEIPPRAAVITMSTEILLDQLNPHFHYKIVTTIGGEDFHPPQPVRSMLVKATRVMQQT